MRTESEPPKFKVPIFGLVTGCVSRRRDGRCTLNISTLENRILGLCGPNFLRYPAQLRLNWLILSHDCIYDIQAVCTARKLHTTLAIL